jgi:UDP-N-acetylenolpyruvoylglucosamine reductase
MVGLPSTIRGAMWMNIGLTDELERKNIMRKLPASPGKVKAY